jgi:hypothetical protein
MLKPSKKFTIIRLLNGRPGEAAVSTLLQNVHIDAAVFQASQRISTITTQGFFKRIRPVFELTK